MIIEAIIDGEKYEIAMTDEANFCKGCSFQTLKGRCCLSIDCPLGNFAIFKKKEVTNEQQ